VSAANHLVPATVESRAIPGRRFSAAFGPRFYLLLLLGLVWIGPAWANHRFITAMFGWDFLALVIWAFDLMRLPQPADLTLRRVWTSPVALATPASLSLELENHGGRAVIATIVDDVPGVIRADLPELSLTVRAGETGTTSYAIEPSERGDAKFGRAGIRYQSTLGVAERWAAADIQQTVRVYPNLEEARRQKIFLIRSRQIELEKPLKRQRGQGREFECLRDYRAGDEWRDVCWTATARRGTLVTKVFQTERSQTVWILVDAGRLLRARVAQFSKLDYAVNAALSLAQVAFYSGDRVGMLAYGRRPQQRVGAGRGGLHLRSIIESLAQVHGEPYEADHMRAADTLMGSQQRRSLVVWITDLAETASTPEVIEAAALLARRHLVLLVVIAQPELRQAATAKPANLSEMYRYAAALEVVQRREIFLRQVRQLGVLTLEAEAGKLSMSVINRYLEVKERNLL
jgi:uncharacterized protein (DUF58 family)